ncbi:hypothetical protein HZC30_00450 [Candidatus Woesearchaeota archaeon]|nr:hypothetical protein [Candidatus Woesearchaeota archaeon]
MNKKAMGVGQVFIYIVAAISFALIMIFGYKAINSFLQSGEQVQLVQFKTDLESSIKKVYTEYGSVRVEKYRIPGNFEQICLVNMEYPATPEEIDDLCKENVYACKVWEDAVAAQKLSEADPANYPKDGYDSVDENVFLTPITEGLTQLKVYRISIDQDADEVEEGFLCEPIKKGSFSLVLEGKGDHTQIYQKTN